MFTHRYGTSMNSFAVQLHVYLFRGMSFLLHVHVHACTYRYGVVLRKCRCSIGPRCCPVVFYMGVVDQTHCDDHGQELFELISVVNFFVPAVYARESSFVNILLSIDVCLLNNMIQHGIIYQKLCQSCPPKGQLAAGSLGWEVHDQMALFLSSRPSAEVSSSGNGLSSMNRAVDTVKVREVIFVQVVGGGAADCAR